MTDTVKALARGVAMIAVSLLAAVFLAYAIQQYSIRILDERFKWSNEIVGIIWVCLLFFWGPLLVRKWLSRGAEFIAAMLLAAVFIVFLLQIFSRYVLLMPFGWTLELCLILWVWIVFFGCAFVVRQRDQVTFDILYFAVPKPVRLVFGVIACLSIVLAFAWAFVPTWDYIDWMKMRKTATVRNPLDDGAKIPLRTIFMVFVIFMVAVIARFIHRTIEIIRMGPDEDLVEQETEAMLREEEARS